MKLVHALWILEALPRNMSIGWPLYVYRMWGGSIALEDIETAMAEIKEEWIHEG